MPEQPSRVRKVLLLAGASLLIVACLMIVKVKYLEPLEATRQAEAAEKQRRIEAQLAEDREAARKAQERLRENPSGEFYSRRETVTSAVAEPPITLAEFLRIRTGMSYGEVVDVLGEFGEELSRTDLPGIPTTIMYGWRNPDGSNMNATFQGGSLIQKAQFGLR